MPDENRRVFQRGRAKSSVATVFVRRFWSAAVSSCATRVAPLVSDISHQPQRLGTLTFAESQQEVCFYRSHGATRGAGTSVASSVSSCQRTKLGGVAGGVPHAGDENSGRQRSRSLPPPESSPRSPAPLSFWRHVTCRPS